MTKYVAAAALALLSFGAPAHAQNQFEGLDLSDDSKKDDPKKKPPDDSEGIDLTGPAPTTSTPTKKDAPKKPLAKKDDLPAGERDITQDDRVKSVQRKLYIKRGRFELAPAFVLNINDPYYTRLGAGLRLAFYPADSLAVALRVQYLATLPTDDVRAAKISLQSRIFFSVPILSALADLEWSLLYGKVAFFNSILHLDGYLLGGGGVVYTATSGAVGRPVVNPAFDLGVGLRFVVKDFFAVNLALVNTSYADVPIGTTKGSLQNLMTIQAGFALFFPFKSTFREAE